MIGVAQGAPNGSLLFLAVTPLVPVAAVAFAYGQDVDPMWDTTLAAPYSPLRLLLLRSVSVVRRRAAARPGRRTAAARPALGGGRVAGCRAWPAPR